MKSIWKIFWGVKQFFFTSHMIHKWATRPFEPHNSVMYTFTVIWNWCLHSEIVRIIIKSIPDFFIFFNVFFLSTQKGSKVHEKFLIGICYRKKSQFVYSWCQKLSNFRMRLIKIDHCVLMPWGTARARTPSSSGFWKWTMPGIMGI